jgi:hypothetical protein
VQPLLGLEGDPMRLLFERDLTPHPQYAASYKWLQQVRRRKENSCSVRLRVLLLCARLACTFLCGKKRCTQCFQNLGKTYICGGLYVDVCTYACVEA